MKTSKRKVFLVDGSKDFLKKYKQSKEASSYHIETASSGKECLEKIKQFQPELVVIEFMLPGMHALEILKIIRDAPMMKKIGVIITSYNGMIQNYHAAIKLGANYYLEKPFTPKSLFRLIDRFFASHLQPDPFPMTHHPSIPDEDPSLVEPKYSSYIKFWGSRGSNPVSGAEYVRFGGNTCCLELKSKNNRVIIDAGTGIRGLGNLIQDAANTKHHIFFSHTHWDHLLGFPFFSPIYNPSSEIHLWAPVGFEKSTKELFTDMLTYAYFPVELSDIRSKIIFKDLRDSDSITIGDITIKTHYAFHPGATLCFKIEMSGKTFGYVTDNEFLMGFTQNIKTLKKKQDLLFPYQSMIHFFRGCDFIIHEAQYTSKEYTEKVGWGHSSLSNATALVLETQIKDWIVTHHDPKHTDKDLIQKSQMHRDIFQQLNYPCQVRLAYDGLFLPL